jgi:hypothetical protein
MYENEYLNNIIEMESADLIIENLVKENYLEDKPAIHTVKAVWTIKSNDNYFIKLDIGQCSSKIKDIYKKLTENEQNFVVND